MQILTLLFVTCLSTLQSDATATDDPSLFVMENQCKVSIGSRLISSKYAADEGFRRAFFAVEQHVSEGNPKTEIAFYYYSFGAKSEFERIKIVSSPLPLFDKQNLYESSENRINDKQDNAKKGTELRKFLSSLLSFPIPDSPTMDRKVFVVDKSRPLALLSGSKLSGIIVASNGKQSTYKCEDKFFEQLSSYVLKYSSAFENAVLHCAVGERGSLQYSIGSGKVDLIFSEKWSDYTEFLGPSVSSGVVTFDVARLRLGNVAEEAIPISDRPKILELVESIVIRNTILSKKIDPLTNLIKPKK